jgi:uncharacterized protein (DUF427 family)
VGHHQSAQSEVITYDPEERIMSQTRIDPTARRIRAFYGGTAVGDSTTSALAYTEGRHPEYLLPTDSIAWDRLEADMAETHDDPLGGYHDVLAGDGAVVGRRYDNGPADGYVQFDFATMDAWFEEEEQIFFHPRDPFRRVDVIESSRHVEVRVNGVTVAETTRPRLVTETALPERWYIPRADIEWSKLLESTTTSACQYKGIADWWHVDVDGEQLGDVAWGYERPVNEAPKLAGLVAFYGEHAAVETLIDGVAQPKPEFDPSWLNPSLHLANVAA